jgi:hypothetical protein
MIDGNMMGRKISSMPILVYQKLSFTQETERFFFG